MENHTHTCNQNIERQVKHTFVEVSHSSYSQGLESRKGVPKSKEKRKKGIESKQENIRGRK